MRLRVWIGVRGGRVLVGMRLWSTGVDACWSSLEVRSVVVWFVGIRLCGVWSVGSSVCSMLEWLVGEGGVVGVDGLVGLTEVFGTTLGS